MREFPWALNFEHSALQSGKRLCAKFVLRKMGPAKDCLNINDNYRNSEELFWQNHGMS